MADDREYIELIIKMQAEIMKCAEAISQHMKNLPIKKKGRRITKHFRDKLLIWKLQLWLIKISSAAQIAHIRMQPVPKFPSGGTGPFGFACVGDGAREVIVTQDFNHKITIDPKE